MSKSNRNQTHQKYKTQIAGMNFQEKVALFKICCAFRKSMSQDPAEAGEGEICIGVRLY